MNYFFMNWFYVPVREYSNTRILKYTLYMAESMDMDESLNMDMDVSLDMSMDVSLDMGMKKMFIH